MNFDREPAMGLQKQYASPLIFISHMSWKDEKVVFAAVRYIDNPFDYASDSIRSDKEIIKEMIK